MDLSNLKPAKGAVKSGKRIARGQGSGRGGTSTRGHKGAKSRSGYKSKRGFEGGQMPLQRRLPKRGFKNPNRIEFRTFNIALLQAMAEKYSLTEINLDILKQKNMIKKSDVVKILGNGDLTIALNVSAHAFSEKAKEAITNAGGTVNVL